MKRSFFPQGSWASYLFDNRILLISLGSFLIVLSVLRSTSWCYIAIQDGLFIMDLPMKNDGSFHSYVSFVSDFPIRTSIHRWFSIVMWVYQGTSKHPLELAGPWQVGDLKTAEGVFKQLPSWQLQPDARGRGRNWGSFSWQPGIVQTISDDFHTHTYILYMYMYIYIYICVYHITRLTKS